MLFGTYRFHCRFESDAVLPHYKGSTFRGVFGIALKQVVCALKGQACETCLLRQNCVYTLVFETKISRAVPAGVRLSAPPHPFVIEPPLTSKQNFQKGAAFDFDLLLFGEVNRLLPYFIYAFDRMGRIGIGRRVNSRRGRFFLKTVHNNGQCIYAGADQILKEVPVGELLPPAAPPGALEKRRLSVELRTPLRLKYQNRLSAVLPFHILVRAALRRITSLFACYGNGEPDLDFAGLVQRARQVQTADANLRWFDWRRYSSRQDQKMLMGGMVGSITYEGILNEFLPVIDLAARVHLGKQTSFGLGQIETRPR